jgi:hypothetical protein
MGSPGFELESRCSSVLPAGCWDNIAPTMTWSAVTTTWPLYPAWATWVTGRLRDSVDLFGLISAPGLKSPQQLPPVWVLLHDFIKGRAGS